MDDRGKTAQENITPHFYNIHGDGKEGLKEAEGKASGAPDGKTASGGGANSKNVSDGVSASLKNGFQNSVNGGPMDVKKAKGMLKTFGKASAAVAAVLILFGVIISVMLTPQFLIGNIDYNLQRQLFGDTVAILEKQSEYVTVAALKEGKVREDYAVDLENNGLLVGQIAANGEFVRTNSFIADLGIPKELASTEVVYGDEALDISIGKQEDGQLVMKYNNEIVNADNFIAKVESDPKMYYAYSTALNIASRYHYSDEVTEYYQEYGLSRNSFAAWQPSGNKQTDDENFEEILEKILGNTGSVGVDGLDMEWYEMCGKEGQVDKCKSKRRYATQEICEGAPFFSTKKWESCEPEYDTVDQNGNSCEEGEVCTEKIVGYRGYFDNNSLDKTVSEFGDASELATAVSEGTMIEGNAQLSKDKAVSILNAAVSANEPYVAAKTFLAIEEAINRARAGDEGPVNQVMDKLAEKRKAKITNPNTGETVETYDSIFNTHNFAVAASDGGPYSKEEAAMYSRDNIINTMNNNGGTTIDANRINNTSVSAGSSKQGNILMTMNHEGDTAGDLELVNNTLNNTFYNDPIETLSTTVGGNRVVSGGSFLSNSINQSAIGALPSDTEQMTAYNEVVEEVIARKNEAERSVLSPFDISSKNTFFGKIVHDLASVMIYNYGKGGGSGVMNMASTVAGMTNDSIANVMTGASAAAEDKYTMLNGDCPSPNSAYQVNGDIYCSSHNTVYLGYMNYTEEDYRNNELIGDSFDAEGNIKDDGIIGETTALGSGRSSSVGNANADVCKRYKEMHEGEGGVITTFLKNFVGVNQYVAQYERCANDEEELENEDVDGSVNIISDILNLFGATEPQVPVEVATGAKYTLSESNPDVETMRLYSAYSMYEMVKSMLTEDENEVTAFKERYYTKYPKDNSAAGIIARRSGMTTAEAQIALNYADYLTTIANYNPAERMVFGKVKLDIEDKMPIEIKENQDYGNTLALIVTSKNGQIVRREDNTTV